MQKYVELEHATANLQDFQKDEFQDSRETEALFADIVGRKEVPFLGSRGGAVNGQLRQI